MASNFTIKASEEAASPARSSGLESGGCRREIGRKGLPCFVDVSLSVDGKAIAPVVLVPADVGDIDEGGGGRIQLGYEDIPKASGGVPR